MPRCERITSEEYADFIGRYGNTEDMALQQFDGLCPQLVNDRYVILYERISDIDPISMENYVYSSIPKLYGLMDTTAVAATGSLQLQEMTGFRLTGRDVIVGFIDTGIDYTNEIFRFSTGQTRILSIWDQSDESGNTPDGFSYGSEYLSPDINRALESENPNEVVPHRDENGHGTFMASVACGRASEENDFIGAAPDSQLVVVKLKKAKQYLKDYFYIEGEEVYQENDIMLAVSYLRSVQLRENKPMVIVLGVGSGNGSRIGGSPLAQVLDDVGNIIGTCVLVCAGNEGSERLHYEGQMEDGEVREVELRVGEGVDGMALELWGKSPDIFSVSFVSPLGESTPEIAARKDASETIEFLLDGTVLEINYSLVESGSGEEVIFMRFTNPSAGIWVIRVYGNNILDGQFNIWGNLRQFTNEDTYFLNPQPNGTITVPSGSENIITVGGFDSYNNGIYPNTGRGLEDGNEQKPDIVAPAVNVFGAGINNNFVRRTGTSVAVALTAGCCAQLLQWGVVEGNEPYMKTNYIRNYLIRGADRDRDINYPSTQWGYGKINLVETFNRLVGL